MKKSMKRLAFLLAATLMILAFSGCDTSDNESSGLSDESKAVSSTGTSAPDASQAGENSNESDASQSGGSTSVQVENKVDLSIDKTVYEKEERVEVTLDFGKLVKENAVVVIINSDAAHGSEAVAHDESSHEEYRWLADFSETPFYMWAPDKDGLFDVRVYADSDGGEELASVTFAVGVNAPEGSESQPPKEDASRWFTDEVLAEMKLTGFTQPEGFEVLTDEELPDNMEGQPYYRALKGADSMDEYFSTIEKAFNILKENYGEVYTWNYYPNEYPSYKWENSLNYGGDPFYVWDGDIIRSVGFTFSSSWDGVEGEVLQISLNANADDPRDDYDWQ